MKEILNWQNSDFPSATQMRIRERQHPDQTLVLTNRYEKLERLLNKLISVTI